MNIRPRTKDYASKLGGIYVSIEDCSRIEKDLEWTDEKLANAKFGIDKVLRLINDEIPESSYDLGWVEGMQKAVNIIESEMNKIIRRK